MFKLFSRKIDSKKINLIVYDFDGVMTDNRVYCNQDGLEFIAANRGDGLGINIIKEKGLAQIILSTEINSVVQARANKIGIPSIFGVENKKKVLEDYCKKNHIKLNNVLYVGNDINDYEVMLIVGIPVSPRDAHPKIKKISRYVTRSKGGYGVIRELADYLV